MNLTEPSWGKKKSRFRYWFFIRGQGGDLYANYHKTWKAAQAQAKIDLEYFQKTYPDLKITVAFQKEEIVSREWKP